jgi:hypothetical protein
LEDCAIESKDLKHQIAHSSRYSVLSPPYDACGSLMGKLFHATKENTELKQEVAYFTSRLKRTVVIKKLIEDDLSRIEDSATKSTYKLGVGALSFIFVSFTFLLHFLHTHLSPLDCAHHERLWSEL